MLSFAPVALPVALVGCLIIYFTAPRLLKGAQHRAKPVHWTGGSRSRSRARALAVAGRPASSASPGPARLRAGRAPARGRGPDARRAPIEADDVLVFDGHRGRGPVAVGEPACSGLAPHRLYAVSVRTPGRRHSNDLEDGDVQLIAARTTTCRCASAELVPGRHLLRAPRQNADVRPSTRRVSRSGRTRPAGRRSHRRPGSRWHPGAVIVAASFGLAPVELTAVAGAVLMVLTGVLTPSSAARALDWNVLFILAGSVGLGAIVLEQRPRRRAGQRRSATSRAANDCSWSSSSR